MLALRVSRCRHRAGSTAAALVLPGCGRPLIKARRAWGWSLVLANGSQGTGFGGAKVPSRPATAPAALQHGHLPGARLRMSEQPMLMMQEDAGIFITRYSWVHAMWDAGTHVLPNQALHAQACACRERGLQAHYPADC